MNTTEVFSVIAANAVAGAIGHKFVLPEEEARNISSLNELNMIWKQRAFEYNRANGYEDSPPSDCPYGWLEFRRGDKTVLAHYGSGPIVAEVSDYLNLTFYAMSFPSLTRKIVLSFTFRVHYAPGYRFRGLILNRESFRLFPKAIDKLWEIDVQVEDVFIGEIHELISLYRIRGTHPYIEIAYFLFLKNSEYLLRKRGRKL